MLALTRHVVVNENGKPSSNIAEIGWLAYELDAEEAGGDPLGELHVLFHQGARLYTYDDVPQSVYAEFCTAPSAGKFFLSEIKGNYDYTRET